MARTPFVDYYECLQISPNADSETVERVFRLMAKRYHPDNEVSGDTEKFQLVVRANRVLSNPESRAAYDARYEQEKQKLWKTFSRVSDGNSFDDDRSIRHAILSVLYTARRQDPSNSGVGTWQLEKLLDSPQEHIDFHVWYLKEKGLIQRDETGGFSITFRGVDAIEEKHLLLRKDRLLPDITASGFGPQDRRRIEKAVEVA